MVMPEGNCSEPDRIANRAVMLSLRAIFVVLIAHLIMQAGSLPIIIPDGDGRERVSESNIFHGVTNRMEYSGELIDSEAVVMKV